MMLPPPNLHSNKHSLLFNPKNCGLSLLDNQHAIYGIIGRRVAFNANPPPRVTFHWDVSNQSTIDSSFSNSSISRMFGITSLSSQRWLRLLMDQCERLRFPFKKKLILANLNLNHEEIPVDDFFSDTLGTTLYKLSLAGNRLHSIPEQSIVKLTGLWILDISQCDLQVIPVTWNMPLLKKLIMTHNQIKAFPNGGEKILHPGLHLALEMPNMFWNLSFGVDNLFSECFQRSSRIAILGFATQQVDLHRFSLGSNPID